MVRHLPPPEGEASGSRGIVLLGVPLMIGGEAQPPESAEGPLHDEDIVFGALAFTYQNRRSLDDNRVRIARAFADQAALAIENARLRARIEEAAIEAERTRLARDLHDSVTQSLFAASLKAEALAEMLDDPEVARNAVEELRRLTRGSLAGMRTMLLEMRVDALTQTPLPELLRHLVEAGGGRIGADVRLNVEGRRRSSRRTCRPPCTASRRRRSTTWRVTPGQARSGSTCGWAISRVRLEIGDDGHGFDPDTESAGHFGLRNMRERAEAIGGRFGIVTGPGRGTVVTVEWPLEEGEDRCMTTARPHRHQSRDRRRPRTGPRGARDHPGTVRRHRARRPGRLRGGGRQAVRGDPSGRRPHGPRPARRHGRGGGDEGGPPHLPARPRSWRSPASPTRNSSSACSAPAPSAACSRT